MNDWRPDEVPPKLAAAPGPDYPRNQCTFCAAKWVLEETGSSAFYFPRKPGEPARDAKEWDKLCAKTGACDSHAKPKVHSVAQFKGGAFAKYGHVAVVTNIHPDGTFDVRECNWPLPLTEGTRTHLDPSTVATFLYPTSI